MHRAQPSGPSALDRPGLDPPAVLVQPKETLGRGAENRELTVVEVGGERRRIAPPELPVELERRLDQTALEPLREVGLEDVARNDVLPDPRYRIEISPVGKSRAEPDVLGALDPRRPGYEGSRLRRCAALPPCPPSAAPPPRCPVPVPQPLAYQLHPFAGPPLPGGPGIREAGRDHPGRANAMVPRDHPVIEAEHHVRNGEIIVSGARRRSSTAPQS